MEAALEKEAVGEDKNKFYLPWQRGCMWDYFAEGEGTY